MPKQVPLAARSTRALATLHLVLLAGFAPGFAQGIGAQTTGTVEGTVSLALQPPRRSAARYPGAPPAARTVQAVPAVVYVEGRIEGAPSAPTSADVMAQHDTAFAPAALLVDVGSTVHFPNEDSFFHNVFSYSATSRFDLGRYPRGESKDVVFDKPGIVKVYCEVHEFMRSVIVVTENPFHAVVGPDGRYRLSGLPPGTYTVVFWHPDVEPVQKRVTVRAGGTVVANADLR